MTYAENVPVKMNGVAIGVARVDDDGTIEIKIGAENTGNELLRLLEQGFMTGLSLGAIVEPAVDASGRVGNQRPPLWRYDGFHFDHPPNEGHNYTSQ